jgi:arginase
MPTRKRRIAVIEAPSNLGLMPPAPGRVPGVTGLPDALRAAGLVTQLDAIEAGRVGPPPYSPEIDPKTRIRNTHAIREFSIALARRVEKVIERGHFPLVLGGDCSILVGNMLALRQRGRHGLFFVDGQVDFRYPETSPTGGAAGMDLAIVSGRGPDVLTDIDGLKPLVQDRDVVVFGYRDVSDPHTAWRDIRDSGITLEPLEAVREVGLADAATKVLAYLAASGIVGFWIHLDVDVLDDAIMPAVDTRQPGGMSYAELSDLLRVLLVSGLAVGMDITIFDPELDADGSIARALTGALVEGLTRAD